MAQPVGIQLVLKENIADRLGKVLPMLDKMEKTFQTLNKTLNNLETSQKRVDKNFQNIARSVDTVSQKERGLKSLNTGIQGIGSSATRATGLLGNLGRSFSDVIKMAGPLLGIYKLIQGGMAVGGEGLDFEKNVRRMQMSQYTPKQRQQAEQQSIKLAQSGKYAMSGAQNLDYVLRGGAISADKQGVIDSMELMNKVDFAMRKLNVEDSLAGDTPLLMNQIWEKLGDRTTKQKMETADLLAKFEGYYAGQVPLNQFSRQLQRTRGAKLGADKEGLFGQLFHGISEQLTSGGGGGGQGGVGQGYLALDTLLSGKMSKEMQAMWDEAGLFPGLHNFPKKKKGRLGSDTIVNQNGMMHHTGRSGSTSSGYDFNKYLADAPPPWYDLAGEDQRAFMQTVLKPAIERRFHLAPGGFAQQKDVEQKRMVRRFFPGATQTAIGQVIENITGRYAQTVAQQQAGVKKQMGIEGVLKNATSVEDKWAALFNSFKALGDSLGKDQNVISALTNSIDALSSIMKLLNDNVTPIANFLTAGDKAAQGIGGWLGKVGSMFQNDPENMDQRKGSKSKFGLKRSQWGGGSTLLVGPPIVGDADINSVPMKTWNQLSAADRANARSQGYYPASESAQQHSSTGNTVTHAAVNAIDRIVNHPAAGPKGSEHTRQFATEMQNLWKQGMSNLHITVEGTDNLVKVTSAKATTKVQNAQLKTTLKQSNSGSQAGGGYTDRVHNAGGGQE